MIMMRPCTVYLLIHALLETMYVFYTLCKMIVVCTSSQDHIYFKYPSHVPYVMVPGMMLAIAGTAVAAAIFGSIAFQYVIPTGDGIMTPLEQRCMDIARQGHAIHSVYPDMTLDEMPVDDVREMLRLDEIWMRECVPNLPPSIIVEIADAVSKQARSHGE